MSVLLSLECGSLYAQKFDIKTYTVNDGLPSSQVYDVYQDTEGIVWFATPYGIVRFDGYEYQTIGIDEGLRDEIIYDIYEDSADRFWVSTESGGVGILKEGKVQYMPSFSYLDSMVVNIIQESPDGDLWFGTYKHGVIRWDGQNFNRLTVSDELPANRVWDINFYEERVWIATSKGLGIYHPETGMERTYSLKDGLSGESIYQVFKMNNGDIWMPSNSGITVIRNGKIHRTLKEVNGNKLNYVYNVSQDEDGLIWIGTERNGLYWYDGNDFTHITRKNGLSSNYIYRIVKAYDGTMWVATDGNGVSLFRTKEFKFYDQVSKSGSVSINSFYKDEDGQIWFGMTGGIGRMHEGKFQQYPIRLDIFDEGDEIWDIEMLPNGNLLLLTYNFWVIEFDGTSFLKSDYTKAFSKYYISDLLIDRQGSVWASYSEGLLRYNEGKIETLKPSDNPRASYVHVLFQDSKDRMWLGTDAGIALKEEEEFRYYATDIKGIYVIQEDNKGNIWVGTSDGFKVIIMDDQQSVADTAIENFKPDKAYLQETVSLLFDENGGLWQGTNAGLNYYDIEQWYETGKVKYAHFALQEYGTGVEFNGRAAIIDDNKDIWFGTTRNGILKYEFEPGHDILGAARTPESYIRSVYADEQLVYSQNSDIGEEKEPVPLKYAQNNLEFNFGSSNFIEPNRMHFKYKLEGFDEVWKEVYDKREIEYTNLDPGQYEFKVMAKSPNSVYSEQVESLFISIAKPFWLTGWFYILLLITMSALIYIYIRLHIMKLEKKKLTALVEERTSSLKKALEDKEILIKEIHHRVKNNLAVVSGMLELQSWKMEEGAARDAIEESKLRIKTISNIHEKLYQNEDLSEVNFKDFTQELISNILRSIKYQDKQIDVIQEIEVHELNVNMAIPCGLMLNELLSNAFEHAFKDQDQGSVKVVFKKEEGHYILQVSDDGVGMEKNVLSHDRSSLGLTLIKSLAHQVNGDLSYSNEEGTAITIRIPEAGDDKA